MKNGKKISAVVLEFSKLWNDMNGYGNIIPNVFYKKIRLADGRKKSGGCHKPHLEAITILSEIAYWYRVSVSNDEDGNGTVMQNRFSGKKWNISYSMLENKFGIDKRGLMEITKFLEEVGIIKKSYIEKIQLPNGTILYNRLEIEPVVSTFDLILDENDNTLFVYNPSEKTGNIVFSDEKQGGGWHNATGGGGIIPPIQDYILQDLTNNYVISVDCANAQSTEAETQENNIPDTNKIIGTERDVPNNTLIFKEEKGNQPRERKKRTPSEKTLTKNENVLYLSEKFCDGWGETKLPLPAPQNAKEYQSYMVSWEKPLLKYLDACGGDKELASLAVLKAINIHKQSGLTGNKPISIEHALVTATEQARKCYRKKTVNVENVSVNTENITI